VTEPREGIVQESGWMIALRKAGVPLLSILLAMLVGSLVIVATGKDPLVAFAALLQGAFGGWRQIGDTILRSTPLIFTGLAVAFGFRANLFNIGAEGQLFIGGLAAAILGVALGGLPWFVSVPAIIVLGALAGAAWAFIPALLKAKVGAHEVITTMMFSYIGRYLVSYLVNGPIRGDTAIPQTALIPPSATLPTFDKVLTFLEPSRAHFGFILAIAVAIAIWLILKYTTLGYEVRAVGYNPLAAENAGISISWTTVRALCISGALAGLAGVVEVIGVHHRLFDQFSSGFGFTGIAVALLAKNHPIAIIPAALLFGALSAGGPAMQLEADVPLKLISIIQALVIFFVAAETVITYFIKKRQKEAITDAE
jgi:ABC-type uncharacterized transport system permease subunit